MLKQNQLPELEAVQFLGECHPLLAQLGSADGLFTLNGAAACLSLPSVDSYQKLALFLQAYQSQVMIAFDWPAIYRAHHHANNNETSELVALDAEISGQGRHKDFASASRRVGRSQLERLRPLRDVRIAQRYLQSVEQGKSQAWHTLVYGLTLAVYSLPVRQGLVSYARQTLQGFIQAAARSLRLSVPDCDKLLEAHCGELPAKLETLLHPAQANYPR